MMRSLYSAISGLRNHQIKMDVVGNNIANVNTTGFKRSNVNFATALSQTMKGASAPSPSQGGSNPMQVGLGVMLGSINQIMTQGSTQTTGKATDLMLQGSGFFVLNNNGQQVYTRSGGFERDSNGALIDPGTGAKVQGYSWGVDDSTTPVWSALGDIRFKPGDVLLTDTFFPIPEEDTIALATDLTETTAPEYDTGVPGAENLTIEGMTRVATGTTPATGQYAYDPATGYVTFAAGFDPAGSTAEIHYVAPAGEGNNTTTIDTTAGDNTAIVDYPPKPGAIVYNDLGGTPTAYTLTDSDTPGELEYAVESLANGQYKIIFGTDGTGADTEATEPISYDFINEPHVLADYSIDQSGVITGVYSNGVDSVTHKIAQIAVASFANDAGLQNVGGSFYLNSNNSGIARIGAAGEDGRASIVSGALEMSNVDLSQEMTDMITTQRGFQANSRVITVSDTLLQELIDLKR